MPPPGDVTPVPAHPVTTVRARLLTLRALGLLAVGLAAPVALAGIATRLADSRFFDAMREPSSVGYLANLPEAMAEFVGDSWVATAGDLYVPGAGAILGVWLVFSSSRRLVRLAGGFSR